MPLVVRPNPDLVGDIYAHLFGNELTGVPRGLYWSVTVPCVPIEWCEQQHECSITCEWLEWPIRSWKQLHGMSLSTVRNPALVECSLYFAEHHPIRLEKLELRRSGGGTRFRISLAGAFDLDGFDKHDGMNMRFSIESDIEFEGLIVVPDNLFPKPQGESEILQALQPFVELGAFGGAVLDRFRYILAPSIGDA